MVKLATMAAMAIWRLPSCRKQPGCRPKQAACPYLPSLVGGRQVRPGWEFTLLVDWHRVILPLTDPASLNQPSANQGNWTH